MQILVLLTEPISVVQQRFLASENTATGLPHAETITNNGLTFA